MEFGDPNLYFPLAIFFIVVSVVLGWVGTYRYPTMVEREVEVWGIEAEMNGTGEGEWEFSMGRMDRGEGENGYRYEVVVEYSGYGMVREEGEGVLSPRVERRKEYYSLSTFMLIPEIVLWIPVILVGYLISVGVVWLVGRRGGLRVSRWMVILPVYMWVIITVGVFVRLWLFCGAVERHYLPVWEYFWWVMGRSWWWVVVEVVVLTVCEVMLLYSLKRHDERGGRKG